MKTVISFEGDYYADDLDLKIVMVAKDLAIAIEETKQRISDYCSDKDEFESGDVYLFLEGLYELLSVDGLGIK